MSDWNSDQAHGERVQREWSKELDSLRARLAECERERDEMVEAVVTGPLKGKTASEAIVALRSEVAELAAMCDADALMLTQVARERDTAIQRAERAEADLAAVACTSCGVRMGDAMCGGCASYPAEERTVAGIVRYLRVLASKFEQGGNALLGFGYAARQIDRGAWRGKEGA